MTIGIANMIMMEVTSVAQQKMGIRRSDIPGARILRITTARSTATIIATASVKLTTRFQKSARLPKPYSGPASGTYANQPASAPVLNAKAPRKVRPPNR